LQKTIKEPRSVPQLDLASGGQGLIAARRKFSEPLRLLVIIVGLVLAVACLNVANLLLARVATRRKEIAARLAAGAGRLRLVRQLLTESMLFAVSGAALGLVFAYWGKDALVALRPLEGAATLPDLKLDLRVLGFTAAVTALTGILFGPAPALRATKVDLISALKDGAGQTGFSRSRLSKGLVVAQVAMSLLPLGMPAALAATRWVESQVFGLKPHDPLTITLVTLLLMAVMALAGYLPARKAARVDPLVALRCD
jgi:ABC-type antimicrobial peptide transport system permease subunit